MAQDLPDDVWSQIAETQWSDRGALHNMSLTSRRMHRLVVPVYFRYLQFPLYHTVTGSGPLMARLIRNTVRARFLLNSPELLRHTRFFSFWEHSHCADLVAEYFAPHEDPNTEDLSWRREAGCFVAVLHDSIYRLIFRMPRLREIKIVNGVMTPLCYAAISSRPLLTSLSLQPKGPPNITHVTPALPYAPRLRNLVYYNAWSNDHSTHPYLSDILDHSILDLEKLTISLILLPFVVSRIPLHHTLSLRALSVADPEFADGLEVAALLQVLRSCPQLRRLDVGGFPDVELTHYLPPPSLPNLSTFFGTSRLLKILSGGTNLVKIDIYDKFNIKEHSLTQVILSHPSHLRELYMERVLSLPTPHDLLTFIRSLAVFQNLEKLDIAYELYISWKDHFSAQDSHNTIRDLLHQLPCLRFLTINSWSGAEGGYDLGCPTSKPGEPADRGHPSLERIYVDFICSMPWSWDSRTGWQRSESVLL